MVQNLNLSISSMYRSDVNISNSNCLIDLPAAAASVDSDVFAFQEIPLTALSRRTLHKLSLLLNSKKILRSEEGYERDWRGLAALAKQKNLCNESTVTGSDPVTKVIQLWCSNNPKTATFAFLERYLGVIDRWDVSDDIYEDLVQDTKNYQTKQQQCSDLKSQENVDMHINNFRDDYGKGSDQNILTAADVIRAQKGLPPQKYDAFVLYANADLNYATEMLTKLEDNPEYNFKLCMKDRDLLCGVQFEHVALTELIEERCKHLIVILTNEFLKSPENKFLVNYTQALQIQHKTRKIVPLIYEENVDIPKTLKIYTHLRYNTGKASLFNFWSKLANSIQNVNTPEDATALSTFHRNSTHSPSAICRHAISTVQLDILPSNPTGTPSITPPDDKKELKEHHRKQAYLSDGRVLRNTHSTGQLHTPYQTNDAFSMFDLSIYNETKKKKKWPNKILKKVFSRSSSKLQEA